MVTGVVYRGADGAEARARAHLTVVCDGMYSVLRNKLSGSASMKHPSFFVGLLLKVGWRAGGGS